MKKNNRYKKSRVVTFTEDFKVVRGKASVVLHKKGARILCHENIAANLKKQGASVKIETFDYEGHVEKAAIKREKLKKEAAKA